MLAAVRSAAKWRTFSTSSSEEEFLDGITAILSARCVETKICQTKLMFQHLQSTGGDKRMFSAQFFSALADACPVAPALPQVPMLVAPRLMQKRPEGVPSNIFLLHAIAHIELNAVHLYIDTAARFCNGINAPADQACFLYDCLDIANDEATHFSWLQQRLQSLGSGYGTLPAHTGLWDAAESTKSSLPARLAVVPLVQEARALDSEARLVQKLKSSGDLASAKVVAAICSEEVRHVAIGMRWFRAVCGSSSATKGAGVCDDSLAAPPAADLERSAREEHEVGELWRGLVRQHTGTGLQRPFNVRARDQAGLPASWYTPLAGVRGPA